MIKDIRNRIRDFVNPENTYVTYPSIDKPITLADYMPNSQADFEGYVIYLTLPQGRPTKTAPKRYADVQTWEIKIRSMTAGIMDENQVENDLIEIGDAIIQALIDNPRMRTSSLVNGLDEVEFNTYRSRVEAFPSGTNLLRQTFTISLSISTVRTSPC